MKNYLLKWAVKLLTKPKHDSKNRFLIVATTALGDTLWATPAILSLRSSFPDSFIGCLTSPIGQEILKENPHLNEVYVIKRPIWKKFFSLRKTLYEKKFDTVLFFHASDRLILPLCSIIGARKIIGTSGINKGLDTLLTHPLPPEPIHEIERRLKMVETIGGKISTRSLSLYLQEEEKISLPTGQYVIIHPGSKDSFKRWPLTHFAKVGLALKEKGINIFLTGSHEEKKLLENLSKLIPGSIIKIGLPFRFFAALIDQVDLLITNDTGPFHMALALNKKVIGIYSPTNPLLCGPYQHKKAIVHFKKPSCMNCIKRKCPLPFCLMQTGPDSIIKSSLDYLNN